MATLSLCLMVRDVEAELARAIDSAFAVADEVVVVDTGSQDQTRAMAAAHGARVLEFPWCDDFAAVRNFLFAQARSDWIFHLDADEALLPESRDELRQVVDRNEAGGAYLRRQDLWDEERADAYTEMWQLRLFPARDLPPQVGRCHPHFVPSLEDRAASKGRPILHTDIRIRHWGYLAERRPGKLRRGAQLMRLELEERPGQLYYLAELARTLIELEDASARTILAEAAGALDRDLEGGCEPGTGGMVLLESLLAMTAKALPPGWPMARVRQVALGHFENSIPIHWQIARQCFLADDVAGAKRHLERIAALWSSQSYDQTISFNPDIVGDELWLNLGVCRLRSGDLAGAEASLVQVDGRGRFGALAEENRALIRGLQNRRPIR